MAPLGPLWPLLKGPLTHQKRKCSKITISSVLLCHTEPTYQKIVSITKTAVFSPLGPLLKGTLTHQNKKKFKRNIVSLHSFVTLSQNTKRLCLYAHTYVFWLLGFFLKIIGPLNGAEMQIFKNR